MRDSHDSADRLPGLFKSGPALPGNRSAWEERPTRFIFWDLPERAEQKPGGFVGEVQPARSEADRGTTDSSPLQTGDDPARALHTPTSAVRTLHSSAGRRLAVALIVLATADILSTILCFRAAGTGVIEGNPLVRGLFPVFGTFGSLLLIYTFAKLPLAWAMGRTFGRLRGTGHATKAAVFAVISLLTMGAVVLNNTAALYFLWRG